MTLLLMTRTLASGRTRLAVLVVAALVLSVSAAPSIDDADSHLVDLFVADLISPTPSVAVMPAFDSPSKTSSAAPAFLEKVGQCKDGTQCPIVGWVCCSQGNVCCPPKNKCGEVEEGNKNPSCVYDPDQEPKKPTPAKKSPADALKEYLLKRKLSEEANKHDEAEHKRRVGEFEQQVKDHQREIQEKNKQHDKELEEHWKQHVKQMKQVTADEHAAKNTKAAKRAAHRAAIEMRKKKIARKRKAAADAKALKEKQKANEGILKRKQKTLNKPSAPPKKQQKKQSQAQTEKDAAAAVANAAKNAVKKIKKAMKEDVPPVVWAGCKKIKVNFMQKNQWQVCPPNMLLTAIHHSGQTLNKVSHITCCKASQNKKTLSASSCTVKSLKFDPKVGSNSNVCSGANNFMAGFYKTGCTTLNCLTKAKCCKLKGTPSKASCSWNTAWQQTMAATKKGTKSSANSDSFIVGFKNTPGTKLAAVIAARECAFSG